MIKNITLKNILSRIGCFALLIGAVFCFQASAQTAQQGPLDDEAVTALIDELKEGLPNLIEDENQVNAIVEKWEAHQNLGGKSRVQILKILFEDVKAVVQNEESRKKVWDEWNPESAEEDPATKKEPEESSDDEQPKDEPETPATTEKPNQNNPNPQQQPVGRNLTNLLVVDATNGTSKQPATELNINGEGKVSREEHIQQLKIWGDQSIFVFNYTSNQLVGMKSIKTYPLTPFCRKIAPRETFNFSACWEFQKQHGERPIEAPPEYLCEKENGKGGCAKLIIWQVNARIEALVAKDITKWCVSGYPVAYNYGNEQQVVPGQKSLAYLQALYHPASNGGGDGSAHKLNFGCQATAPGK